MPFGVSAILPLDVDTKALPFTSKSPPSCGEVSPATDVNDACVVICQADPV